MASRIRTIKPEFFLHELLFDAEKATGLPLRLAFIGLWLVCDREGRFTWRPRTLKTSILPYDEVDFEAILEALAEYNFVVKYSVRDEFYGYVPTSLKHQVINNRERASGLPEPPSSSRASATGGASVDDALSTRAARDIEAHATPLAQSKAEGERNGREGEAEGGKEQAHPPGDDSDFIPDGLASIQYAQFVLEDSGIPASFGLKNKMGTALEMLAREESCAMPVATRRMCDRIRAAQGSGFVKWTFWLEDGGWKQHEAQGVSTEGWDE